MGHVWSLIFALHCLVLRFGTVTEFILFRSQDVTRAISRKKKKQEKKWQHLQRSHTSGLAIAASILLTSLEVFFWTQKCTICELGLWENVKKHWMKRILSLAFGMLPVLPNYCQPCHRLYDFPICVINWQNISFCFQKVFILPSLEGFWSFFFLCRVVFIPGDLNGTMNRK